MRNSGLPSPTDADSLAHGFAGLVGAGNHYCEVGAINKPYPIAAGALVI